MFIPHSRVSGWWTVQGWCSGYWHPGEPRLLPAFYSAILKHMAFVLMVAQRLLCLQASHLRAKRKRNGWMEFFKNWGCVLSSLGTFAYIYGRNLKGGWGMEVFFAGHILNSNKIGVLLGRKKHGTGYWLSYSKQWKTVDREEKEGKERGGRVRKRQWERME